MAGVLECQICTCGVSCEAIHGELFFEEFLDGGEFLVDVEGGREDFALLEDGEQGALGDGALHVELQVGGDLVAVEEAVFVVAGDGDGGRFDADVGGGEREDFGDGAFEVAGDDGHDGVAVDAIHALGFGGRVGDVLLGERVDAEAGDLVFEGGEALELGVEGVAGGFDVFGAAVRGEEQGAVDGEAERRFGVGVEAAEDEDGGGADVDGVVEVAEALGVGDVELGYF